MSNKQSPESDAGRASVYQVRLEGHLSDQWADWFGGVRITLEAGGDTLLTSALIDQAALHGLLKKVRDLGMPLLEVNRVDAKSANGSDGNTNPDPNRSNKESNT